MIFCIKRWLERQISNLYIHKVRDFGAPKLFNCSVYKLARLLRVLRARGDSDLIPVIHDHGPSVLSPNIKGFGPVTQRRHYEINEDS